MRVESRDLIDRGQRKPHLLRQSGEMGRREMTVAILNEMQVLDQQIAPALALAKKRPDFVARPRVDLAALRRARRPAPSASAAAAAVGRNSRRRGHNAHHFLSNPKIRLEPVKQVGMAYRSIDDFY